jgi:hypothetical protein
MRAIGEFVTKVSGTTDTKKLKKSSRQYTYATISLRKKELEKYIGKKVTVRIFVDEREDH